MPKYRTLKGKSPSTTKRKPAASGTPMYKATMDTYEVGPDGKHKLVSRGPTEVGKAIPITAKEFNAPARRSRKYKVPMTRLKKGSGYGKKGGKIGPPTPKGYYPRTKR